MALRAVGIGGLRRDNVERGSIVQRSGAVLGEGGPVFGDAAMTVLHHDQPHSQFRLASAAFRSGRVEHFPQAAVARGLRSSAT